MILSLISHRSKGSRGSGLRRLLAPLTWSLLAVSLWGCVSEAAPGGETQRPRLRVVATTTLVADWVREVGGERVQVQSLIPPGADSHTFQPAPAAAAALQKADLLFAVGLGLEGWLSKLIASAGAEGKVAWVSQGIPPRTGPERVDPHFWFDLRHTQRAVVTIQEALGARDPEGAELYRRRSQAYQERLVALDSWVRQEVATLPPERRKLVTAHGALGYFGEAYGIRIVGAVIAGPSTEREPTAREMVDLVERIRAEGVPAVFVEEGLSPKLAEQIAREAGVRLVNALYVESLGPPGSDAQSYEAMIRHNVRTIVAALR